MEAPTQFDSPQAEITYWRNLAEEYKQSYEECKEELDEFQVSSRELEAELEAQLEQQEAKNRELVSANSRLEMDNEIFKEKMENLQAVFHKRLADLEEKHATVSAFKEELQKYTRELEQMNDDLERGKRQTLTSIEDFESRLNYAIERNAFLENELEEKESMAETVQRLKDEARDLRQELAVKSERRIRPASSLDRTPDNSIPTSPVTTTASTPTGNPTLAELGSNRLTNIRPALMTSADVMTTPVQTPNKVLNQTGTPLTPSARISALNIVGDLLRKVGALESKLASCRNFVKDQPRNNKHSPMNSPRPDLSGPRSTRAKRLLRANTVGSTSAPPPHSSPGYQKIPVQ